MEKWYGEPKIDRDDKAKI